MLVNNVSGVNHNVEGAKNKNSDLIYRHTIGRISCLFRSMIGLGCGALLLFRATGRGIISGLSANQLRKIYYPISLQVSTVEMFYSLKVISRAWENLKFVITAPSEGARLLKIDKIFQNVIWPDYEVTDWKAHDAFSNRDDFYAYIIEVLENK